MPEAYTLVAFSPPFISFASDSRNACRSGDTEGGSMIAAILQSLFNSFFGNSRNSQSVAISITAPCPVLYSGIFVEHLSVIGRHLLLCSLPCLLVQNPLVMTVTVNVPELFDVPKVSVPNSKKPHLLGGSPIPAPTTLRFLIPIYRG